MCVFKRVGDSSLGLGPEGSPEARWSGAFTQFLCLNLLLLSGTKTRIASIIVYGSIMLKITEPY